MDGIDKAGSANNVAQLRPAPVVAATPAVAAAPVKAADASPASQAFALLGHQFRQAIRPVVLRAKRRAGVDHDRAKVIRIDQRH